MQTIIGFVLLFSLSTIILTADVTVYDGYYYDYAKPEQLGPDAVSQFPWKFSYFWRNESFFMYIFISNKSPSVTAIQVIYQLDDRTFEVKNSTYEYGRRKGEECYHIQDGDFNKFSEIKIKLNIYTSKILCSSLLVAKGREVSNIANESLKKEFLDYDIFKKFGCVLVVDLKNKCDGPPLATKTKMDTTTVNADTDVQTINPNNTFTSNSSKNLEITTHKKSANDTKNTKQESSQNVVLIYVIPSVIGMCVIILVIYLISVKKYCHRNLNPVETIELNTYSTANEVVYADLSLVHGDSQPPRRDEESPYAQIIGVFNPADGNVNNK